MGREESKTNVISSGNIPPSHIFPLPAKCYMRRYKRSKRFRLLCGSVAALQIRISTREASLRQIFSTAPGRERAECQRLI